MPEFPRSGSTDRQTDRQAGMIFPAVPKVGSSDRALQQSRDRARPAPQGDFPAASPSQRARSGEGAERRSLPGSAPAPPAAFAAATRETLIPSAAGTMREDTRVTPSHERGLAELEERRGEGETLPAPPPPSSASTP